jgi:hypothetical protein
MTPTDYQASVLASATNAQYDYDVPTLNDVLNKLTKFARKNQANLGDTLGLVRSPVADTPEVALREELKLDLGEALAQLVRVSVDLNIDFQTLMDDTAVTLTTRATTGY